MKNSEGIKIKPEQEWKTDTSPDRVEVIGYYGEVPLVVCHEGGFEFSAIHPNRFLSLLKTHDGADLEAARADGWEVYVEGMAVPTLGTVGVLQSYAGRSCGFVPEEPSVSLHITHTYLYKLKKEPVGYQAYKDAPDHQDKILPIEKEESYTQNDTENPRLRCFRKLADAEAWLKEDEKPKHQLFPIDWDTFQYPCAVSDRTSAKSFGVGLFPRIDGYRIFGFTDDPEWVTAMTAFRGSPSDHEGDRKYAIGRLI